MTDGRRTRHGGHRFKTPRLPFLAGPTRTEPMNRPTSSSILSGARTDRWYCAASDDLIDHVTGRLPKIFSSGLFSETRLR